MKNKKKSGEPEDLPGYPHYPPEEDILNSAENVPLDIENVSRAANPNTTISAAGKPGTVKTEKDTLDDAVSESLEINEADVTNEDISALGEIGLSIDDGDDEILRNRPYDEIAGDAELDIPGAELDDVNEDIGSEDEENNYYSLGGDKD